MAKELHWVVAISEDGKVLINRENAEHPTAIGELIGELQALDVDVIVGVNMTAGIALARRRVNVLQRTERRDDASHTAPVQAA